jgi:hypothetical protein
LLKIRFWVAQRFQRCAKPFLVQKPEATTIKL